MAYTWKRNGGVRLSGKLTLGGSNSFKLMSAGDLDWDGVEVGDTTLNTTDDLLDYIKGGNSDIIGRIDELELSNAGYEIRCDKSVCYVGDIVGQGYQNQKLPVSIYKNGTLLSWTNAYTEGITWDDNNFTKPSGGNNLIHWSTSDCYLQGEANKAGTYVFNFKKDDVNIASFMLTVLMKPLESYHTTIYISSQTKPTTPTGGSYNFSTKAFEEPDGGWSTSITGLSTPIWFSTGTVFSDGDTTPTWSEPCIYMDSEIVQTENEYRVKEVAVYKVARGPYTETVNGKQITHNKVSPATPTTTGCYTFASDPANDSFQAPNGWFTEPEAAIAAYKGNAQNNDFKDNYRVWKSYNSYRMTVNKLTNPNTLLQNTYSESGWTNPVEYLNIDKILEDAKSQSELIAHTALQNAYADLNLAEDLETIVDAINSVFAWRIIGDGSSTLSSISSKYTELVDDVDTSSAQHTLFSRFNSYFDSNTNKYSGHIEMINENPLLCVSGYQMKALKFDPVYEGGESKGSKWIAFIPTTTEIRSQISDLNDDLGELSTAVNAMNPHEIRLLVSKGFKKDVTWTEVDVTEWNAARTVMEADPDDEEYDIDSGTIRHGQRTDSSNNWETMEVPSIDSDFISALPTEKCDPLHAGGWNYGHYYRVHYGSYSAGDENAGYKYFRCDYPVSTGFLNVLADRVSLGIAKKTTGQEKGADLTFSFKDQNTNATITADNIVLNGDTIADAIFGKSLNINNTTYLCSDGDVYMGVPNGTTVNPDALDKSSLNTGSGSSRFNHDGSGQLCGGNINWTNNGVLYVKEAHIGESNSDWLIKTLVSADNIYDKDGLTRLMCPVIFAKDSISGQQYHNELFITPQYIFACNSEHESDRDYDAWRIERDGTAMFAKGNIAFNNDGSATLGNASGAHIEMSSAGAISLHGINVNISSANSTTIASGIIGSAEATSILLDGQSGNVGITGKLNTQDLSVGNGACFFKGTNTALSPTTLHGHDYGSGTAGAGHLANGNIWWDKEGNLSIGGQLRLKGTSLEWGGAVQQFELLETDFSHNNVSGENGRHYSHGALYKLPDPMEYEGREILVEVYATGDQLASILGDGTSSHMPVELNGANRGGYDCLRIPCFTIDSNNWKHKWIKWGVDACKYNSCEISHLPKFYILGEPGMYDGSQSFGSGLSQYHSVVTNPTAADRNTRDNVANDLFNEFSSFGITSPGDTTSQIEDAADAALIDALSNSATIRCNRRGGLYLIPTAHKWQQMFDYSKNRGWGTNDPVNHESDTVVLRMKCLAKKVRYSGDNDDAWYYWEIQTTDFIPFFDTAVLSMNGAGTMSDYVDGSRPYDITASEFYNTYEKAIASSLLAFDDNFNVPTLPASSINGGGQLTV